MQTEISEKDGYIFRVLKQWKLAEEEIRQKETELEKSHASITQKMKEIDSLKKAHAEELDAIQSKDPRTQMASLE